MIKLKKIVIVLNERKLYFYNSNTLVNSYPVAIGKKSTPTPTGNYSIVTKIVNPANKFLGTRWMGLSIPNGNYGIHGTPHPWSIGKAISHGCVRMYNHDVETLFPQVRIGTTVEIVHNKSWSENNNYHDNQTGTKYIVKKGDTLWKIAQRFNIPLQRLIEINNIKNPKMIYPGQEIIIEIHPY